MKFEHLLQLYWTKGYLFGGKIVPFRLQIHQLAEEFGGIGPHTTQLLIRRFEWNALRTDPDFTLYALSGDERTIMNMCLARLMTVNNTAAEWRRLMLIRLYLTKTYRGRCQAIGKPARGQRTWSNAWTAYRYNKTVRLFIAQMRPDLQSTQTSQPHHARLVQKTLHRRRRRPPTPIPALNKLFFKKRSIRLWN